MTTVELERKLDLEILEIDQSSYTERELEVLQRIGRIVRNLIFLNKILLCSE